MNGRGAQLDPGLLRGFEPFRHLSDSELLMLATRAFVQVGPPRTRLFERGSDDNWLYCLLEGTLELEAADGGRKRLAGGTEQAQKPIAQLKPRRFSAIAVSPVKYLCINTEGLGDFTEGIHRSLHRVEEFDVVEQDEGCTAVAQEEIIDGNFTLPSLPDVAFKVRQLIDRDDCHITVLARIVNTDPAISAKLLKAANSPLYHGYAAVDTCEKAVARLGSNTTRQLVISFAMHELFRSRSVALQKRMKRLWQHSTEVAAICFVLARLTRRFDPEQAMLAGLLHDIGAVPVLTYAESHPELLADVGALDRNIARNCSHLGGTILRRWHFPEQFATAAAHAEDWQRDSQSGPDFGDLVIVAQLHAFLGRPDMPAVPPMVQLPAFQKITEGKFDASLSLAVLQESKEQIAEMRGILAA